MGSTADVLADRATALRGLDDVDALVDAIGPARWVLLGEASHGTREFYRLRGELTRRLIEDRGFDAVAVEADWPAALRASRYAQDGHMAETLGLLGAQLSERRGRPSKIVVWAHNSHIGDARATEVAGEGQLNHGQLVRERHVEPADTFLVGFTTHTGTVTAASDWDAPAERKRVLPSRPDSIERVLHDTGLERFMLRLRDADTDLRAALAKPRLERAIGVVYRPDTERWSYYFEASLARRFDAVVHLDTTEALPALDAADAVGSVTEPETYPSGV